MASVRKPAVVEAQQRVEDVFLSDEQPAWTLTAIEKKTGLPRMHIQDVLKELVAGRAVNEHRGALEPHYIADRGWLGKVRVRHLLMSP